VDCNDVVGKVCQLERAKGTMPRSMCRSRFPWSSIDRYDVKADCGARWSRRNCREYRSRVSSGSATRVGGQGRLEWIVAYDIK
jgi:hypothetical protein